jgi:predicted AlkP superfamily phosphohydrolase/phosphomutase
MVNEQSGQPRVMVIGFDGATLDLIRPWVQMGLLPNFGRLMVEGAWGELRSTMPPVTPAAWSSIATGMNQGKHGLFDFYAHKENSYATYVVNSSDRHGATLWQLLSQAGYQVSVFNIPATYPPDPVNGTMISGFLTPGDARDASYPAEALDELKKAVPDFHFYPPAIFSQGSEVKFVRDVLKWDATTLLATRHLLRRHPWDFFFTVFTGVDILSHWMWRPMITQDASPSTGDPQIARSLATAIQEVYCQADNILGELLETTGDNTYILVISDHGFGPLDYYMHLNTWLVQRGYLKFKRSPFVQFKYLAFHFGFTPINILELLRALRLGSQVQQVASKRKALLNQMIAKVFLSLADVDWRRTAAYSSGYAGPIYVNLKGRQPQGSIERGDQYEELVESLIADLRALRHPFTGEPFVSKIYRPAQDLYRGPYADQSADLMFEPFDWANQGFGIHDFASNRWLEPTPDRTGTHRMNGIIFLRGPGIRPGHVIQGAALIDVAPTILALMHVPIPREIDGRVLTEPMTEALQAQLTTRYCDEGEPLEKRTTVPFLSEMEAQAIRERLEALGYFS